jgi:hypothetical protein
MNDLDQLTTAPIKDVATALSFRSQRQFLTHWQSAGYRTLRLSPRKHVVFVAHVARFMSERLVPNTHMTEHNV